MTRLWSITAAALSEMKINLSLMRSTHFPINKLVKIEIGTFISGFMSLSGFRGYRVTKSDMPESQASEATFLRSPFGDIR